MDDRLLAARCFAAIDFETADRRPTSACMVAAVRVQDGSIVAQEATLIRPPPSRFPYRRIHGLDLATVSQAPGFAEAWRKVAPVLADAMFLAAHGAEFDRVVLNACCSAAGLRAPRLPWVCTRALARKVLQFRGTLHELCDVLGLPHQPHDALSDATAAAGVVLAIQRRTAASGSGATFV